MYLWCAAWQLSHVEWLNQTIAIWITAHTYLLVMRALESYSQQLLSVQSTVVSNIHHNLFYLVEMFCSSTNISHHYSSVVIINFTMSQ